MSRGKRAKDCIKEISPLLQRDLVNLNLLDVLCYQKDHGTNNYNVIGENGMIVSVCAFDNDNVLTFLPIPSASFRGFNGSSPFIKGGYINRPYIDSEIINKLFSIEYDDLYRLMSPYLNKIQMFVLKCRMAMVKSAITKTMRQRKEFVMLKEDWSNKTIEEEVSGKYGKTYLKLYLSRS